MPTLAKISRQALSTPVALDFRRAVKSRIAETARSRNPRLGSHLFGNWKEVSRRIRTAKMIILFLDFDGTLVAYRPSPDQVCLSAAARGALRKLARHSRVHAAIVSGRRRGELAHFVKVPRLKLLGLYGWENGKNGAQLPPRILARLSQAREMLAKLYRLPDIHVEDKGISLAIHFRGASAQSRRHAHALLRRAASRLRPELRLIRAHNSWEFVPRQVCGKGVAIRAALQGVRKPFLPIYVGDDLTDEPAFAVLRKGITVRVGPAQKTKARFRLEHSGEVCAFLNRLAEELS